MGLFFWKNNRLIDEFAGELAHELYRSINPEKLGRMAMSSDPKKMDKQQKKAHKALLNTVQSLVIKINNFKAAHGIGVYGKARLHLKFKERLLEMGYDESFVNEVNDELLLKTP